MSRARDRALGAVAAVEEVEEKLAEARREVKTLRQEKRRLQERLQMERPHIMPIREELKSAAKVAQSLRQQLVDAKFTINEQSTKLSAVYIALAGIDAELTASFDATYQAGGRAVVREIREILAP